jgi:mRNA interferase HigB
VKRFAARFPQSAEWLRAWVKAVRNAQWKNLVELRKVYPSADAVKVKSKRTVIVFNVCGNKYRFIASIHFNTGKAHTLRSLTHAEYSKESWKDDL